MTENNSKDVWDSVFQTKDVKRVSWHREQLGMSWKMAEAALGTLYPPGDDDDGGDGDDDGDGVLRVLDVGAGASSLFTRQCLRSVRRQRQTHNQRMGLKLRMAILDISEHALELHRRDLDAAGGYEEWGVPAGAAEAAAVVIEYVQGDVADDSDGSFFRSQSRHDQFDLVHDRAVFHFLTDQGSQEGYMRNMHSVLKEGGHLILATFALPDGPLQCSGMDVVRYDRARLLPLLRGRFQLIDSADEYHKTPSGDEQHFMYFHLVKTRQ